MSIYSHYYQIIIFLPFEVIFDHSKVYFLKKLKQEYNHNSKVEPQQHKAVTAMVSLSHSCTLAKGNQRPLKHSCEKIAANLLKLCVKKVECMVCFYLSFIHIRLQGKSHKVVEKIQNILMVIWKYFYYFVLSKLFLHSYLQNLFVNILK